MADTNDGEIRSLLLAARAKLVAALTALEAPDTKSAEASHNPYDIGGVSGDMIPAGIYQPARQRGDSLGT